MFPFQRQIGQRHFKIIVIHLNFHQSVVHISALLGRFLKGKAQLLGLYHDPFQFTNGNFIIGAIHKKIVFRKVLCDPELGIDIFLQVIIVPVQVVGSNIQENGDIGLEINHTVELEAAQFEHIIVVILRSHHHRKAFSHISGQAGIQSRFSQHVVDQACGGCFAVAPGDTDLFGTGIPACKFNF